MIENLIRASNDTSGVWSETMFAVSWQSVLLIAVASLLCALLRNHPPNLRFWVWTVLAAKMLLMPFWFATVTLPVRDVTQEAPALVAVTPVTPSNSPLPSQPRPEFAATQAAAVTPNAAPPALRWPAWLMLAWASVVVIQLIRIVLQWRGLKQLLSGSTPAREELAALVARLCEQVGVRRPPVIRTVGVEISPFVCNARQPVLVVPRTLLGCLRQTGLRQVLLHELAHVRRGDLWWCWLPQAVRTVFWFHPLAYWIDYAANLERELACDALAMKLSDTKAAEYAQTLVSAVRHAAAFPALQATVAQLAGQPLPDASVVDVASQGGRNSYRTFPGEQT